MPARTILHIENDPYHLQMMRLVFDRMSHVRLLTPPFYDPLAEVVQAYQPHLILTDLRVLAGDSLLDAFRCLRRDPALGPVPLMVLSAFDLLAEREMLRHLEVDSLLMGTPTPAEIRQHALRLLYPD